MKKKILCQMIIIFITILLSYALFISLERNKEKNIIEKYCMAENYYSTTKYRECISLNMFEILEELTEYINSNYVYDDVEKR